MANAPIILGCYNSSTSMSRFDFFLVPPVNLKLTVLVPTPSVWFYLFLGFFGGQIFAQCTTRRREPFSLECLILQRDLGEGTKCIPPPILSAKGCTLFLHLNSAPSNATDGKYPVSMGGRPRFQQRERHIRGYR